MSPGDHQSPIRLIETDDPTEAPQHGIGLCLSGGGYRAMLFHAGALWRLNEAGYLLKLDRISSVSGGSIAAGALGLKWGSLDFRDGIAQNLGPTIINPIRQLASRTVDLWAIFLGLVTPGSAADHAARQYARHLLGDATLQDLPDRPRFVINATNVQSGALWRFMKPYMRDYKVGEIKTPRVPLSVAVAASAAFPPVLSPLRLRLKPSDFTPGTGLGLQIPPFTNGAVLTDGGVYDNLGLETVWKRLDTVLVSDGGGTLAPQGTPRRDWFRHTFRVIEMIHSQVGSLRKRSLIASFERKERQGTYWGITTDIRNYELPTSLPCPVEQTTNLAKVPTRLAGMDDETQEKLINWGFAVCDAALRRHVDPKIGAPTGFPYPAHGVG